MSGNVKDHVTECSTRSTKQIYNIKTRQTYFTVGEKSNIMWLKKKKKKIYRVTSRLCQSEQLLY